MYKTTYSVHSENRNSLQHIGTGSAMVDHLADRSLLTLYASFAEGFPTTAFGVWHPTVAGAFPTLALGVCGQTVDFVVLI
jgi:hypothetical protein